MKIGFSCKHFIEWGGGVDFLRICLNGLVALRNVHHKEIEIHVLYPANSMSDVLVRTAKNSTKNLLNKIIGSNYIIDKPIDREKIIRSLSLIDNTLKVHFVKNTDLNKLIRKEKINVVLPVFKANSDLSVPWVGYWYDFQHRYLTELFTEEDRKLRNKSFENLLAHATTIIVNSQSVKEDIFRFYGERAKAKIFSLPISPVMNEDFYSADSHSNEYKKIPQKYFVISNQFWKHKDHLTAFKAFKLFLLDHPDRTFGLVCTGGTQDYRFPQYYTELQEYIRSENLRDNIFILGYLDKPVQLRVLRNATAIIQPTHFEGGPGGGAVYEALAYGIRSIISDIPVNREIVDDTVTFFRKGSVEDLFEKMKFISNQEYSLPSKKESSEKVLKRSILCGEALMDAINHAISKFRTTQ